MGRDLVLMLLLQMKSSSTDLKRAKIILTEHYKYISE